MTDQEYANQILSRWQEQRHLPPEDRFGDIGNMTFGIRANALDLFEIWMERPDRRIEFGFPERNDIREAVNTLTNLLMEIDGNRASALKIITRR